MDKDWAFLYVFWTKLCSLFLIFGFLFLLSLDSYEEMQKKKMKKWKLTSIGAVGHVAEKESYINLIYNNKTRGMSQHNWIGDSSKRLDFFQKTFLKFLTLNKILKVRIFSFFLLIRIEWLTSLCWRPRAWKTGSIWRKAAFFFYCQYICVMILSISTFSSNLDWGLKFFLFDQEFHLEIRLSEYSNLSLQFLLKSA